MIPFPNKKYKIIYADVPWDYLTTGPTKTAGIWGRAHDHYDVMSLEQIKNLDVKSISDDDAYLFLWATFPQIRGALEVINSWGFEYKTVGFVWIKKETSGRDFVGMGWYTRANAEICLLGRKGTPKIKDHSIRQLIYSIPREHSRKPDEVRDKIVKLCGDIPRIELFARIRVHGWTTVGNEIDGQDIRLSLEQIANGTYLHKSLKDESLERYVS